MADDRDDAEETGGVDWLANQLGSEGAESKRGDGDTGADTDDESSQGERRVRGAGTQPADARDGASRSDDVPIWDQISPAAPAGGVAGAVNQPHNPFVPPAAATPAPPPPPSQTPVVPTWFDPPAPPMEPADPGATSAAAESAEAASSDDESSAASSAAEPAAGGFTWQLQPDPNAEDPKVASAQAPANEPSQPDMPSALASPAAPVMPGQPPVEMPAPAGPPIDDPNVGDDLAHWFAAPDQVGGDSVEPADDVTASDATAGDATASDATAGDLPSDDETAEAATTTAGFPPVDVPPETAVFAAAGARSASMPANPPPVPTATTDATAPPAVAGAAGVASGPRGSGRRGGGGVPPSSGANRKRTVRWLVGALIALVVLAGLFVLGTQIPGFLAGPPAATPTPTASATPTPTPEPTAPLPAGTHAWDTLFGGECIDPFESPWAEEFTVVDCAAPHAAQLVYRGVFDGDETTAFPGEAELAAQINILCTRPGVIDIAAASGIPDLQVQGSFPVTEEQWVDGVREYYCFVNRAGAEPITGSIAGPGPDA